MWYSKSCGSGLRCEGCGPAGGTRLESSAVAWCTLNNGYDFLQLQGVNVEY